MKPVLTTGLVGTTGANYQTKQLVMAIERLAKVLPNPAKARLRPQTSVTATARRLTPAERARMLDEYQTGVGTVQLAKLYGVDRETVRATLRKAGVPQQERGLTPEQINEAAKLYQAGQSLARIGTRFDVDAHTVRRRLLERGVIMR